MKISDLINHHNESSKKLLKAIELEDVNSINQLDKSLVSEFNSILDFQVNTSDELVEKTKYLLNQLTIGDQNTPLKDSISSKIIEDIYSFTN